MKRTLFVVVALVLVVALFTACTPAATDAPAAEVEDKEDVSAETPATEPEAEAEDEGVEIPEGVEGAKVALIFNLSPGDYTSQWIDGATAMAEGLGITLDTQVTAGDDAKVQEYVAQCIEKGYDGLIISETHLSYTYDMIKPALDRGIEIVCNNTMPYEDGDVTKSRPSNVTSISQDDLALGTQSLAHMLEEKGKDGEPVKVLKTYFGPGCVPVDRRNIIYEQLEEEGKIETLEIIAPTDLMNIRGDVTNKTAAILPKYKEGEVDAVWGCYDEIAKGVLQALLDAKRTDIPIYMIDISDDDMNLMVKHSDILRSTSACDAAQCGEACVLALALQLAGDENIPKKNDELYDFELAPLLIRSDDLTEDTTMANLVETVPDWKSPSNLAALSRPWMDALRAKVAAGK